MTTDSSGGIGDESDEPHLNLETLDFIFEHIKQAPSEQHQTWASLDGKMVSVFGVGTAVVGLSGLTVSHGGSSGTRAVAALLAVALVAYAGLVAVALVQLWPKDARKARYGDTLWPDAWNRLIPEIKHGLVTDISEGTAANRAALQRKALTLRIGLAAAGAEALFVGVAFIV